jgi:hypothetical protein
LNLIKDALKEVDRLIGRIPRIPDGTVDMPQFIPPAEPKADDLSLSKEVMGILANAINEGGGCGHIQKGHGDIIQRCWCGVLSQCSKGRCVCISRKT